MHICTLCHKEIKFDNFRTKDAQVICSDCVHELNVRDENFEEKQLTDFTLNELKQIMNNPRNTEKYEKKYSSKFKANVIGIIMVPITYFLLIFVYAYVKEGSFHYIDALKETFKYSFPLVIVYVFYAIFFLYKLRKINRKDL